MTNETSNRDEAVEAAADADAFILITLKAVSQDQCVISDIFGNVSPASLEAIFREVMERMNAPRSH